MKNSKIGNPKKGEHKKIDNDKVKMLVDNVSQWPCNERPRERLIHFGPESLSDAELLAILLRTGVKGQTVVDLARDLLVQSGGIRGLLKMSVNEFLGMHGMGMAKYAQLQAASELGKRVLQQHIQKSVSFNSSEQTKDFLRSKLRDKPHEVFAVLFLDTRNQLITFKELFRGTINGASVPVREVVKEAMQFNAASLIVAHNHPSGIAEPSLSDENFTKILEKALALLDVKLLDHIIVGETECWSFAEKGLIP